VSICKSGARSSNIKRLARIKRRLSICITPKTLRRLYCRSGCGDSHRDCAELWPPDDSHTTRWQCGLVAAPLCLGISSSA